MNRTRLGTDRVTLALEFTPLVGQCPSDCNKCRTRTQAGDSKVPKQAKPEIATPEQRERLRALYEKRFPAPPPEAEISETVGSTYSFKGDKRVQLEEEQVQDPDTYVQEGPSTRLVIEKTRAIRRGVDTVNCLAEAVKARANTLHGDRLLAESREHQRQMKEPRLAEWLKKHPGRER